MENNNNDIDKLFKDHLDGHQADYVPGAWEKMEAMLDADDGTVWLHNTQRFVLASIVGAILLAGSVMAYISGGPSDGSFVQSDAANNKNVATQQETNTNSAAGNATDAGTIKLDDVIADNHTGENASEGGNSQPASTKSTAPETKGNLTDIKKKAPAQQLPAVLDEPAIPVAADDQEEMAEETSPVIVAEAPRLPLALLTGLNPLRLLRLAGDNSQLENLELSISLLDSTQKARKAVQEMKRFYNWQLGVYAGFNFNKTLSTADNNFAAGTGFLGGVSLSKNWSSNWGFAADINYLRRTGNTITRTVEQTRYFFEKTTTSYFFITKTMDVLQMPVSVHYNLTRKHKFSLGAMAAWMIDSKTDVNVKTEKIGEKTSEKETRGGVYEDMNRFGYGLWAGYEFRVAGMYSLGLRYNQQLNDITKNSFFNDSKKHLPADLQLYIKLNLNK